MASPDLGEYFLIEFRNHALASLFLFLFSKGKRNQSLADFEQDFMIFS